MENSQTRYNELVDEGRINPTEPIKKLPLYTMEEIITLCGNISSYTHLHNRVITGKELNNLINENLK